MTDLRYTKYGEGRRGGATWRDSRPFSQLSADLRNARPGDSFGIGFDCGSENPIDWTGASVQFSNSGAPGRPVRLEAGCGVSPATVRQLRGTGSRFFVAPNAMSGRGGAPIRIANNASNLVIGGLRVDGASPDGIVKFAPGSYSDIAIRGISARNVARVIETDHGAAVRNLVIEDCDATRIARGFARFRQLDQSVLRNLVLDADRVDLGGDNVTQLIAVTAGSDVRFENITFRNAVNPRAYVQGDGLVCERGTSNFTIRNCRAEGMGDGGFDVKTLNITFEDCSASACKFGMRIWSMGQNVVRRCNISNPHQRGMEAYGCVESHGRADFSDCQFQAAGSAAVFRLTEGGEGPPLLRVFGGAIRLQDNAGLVSGAATEIVELYDVAVNGELRSGRFTSQGGARG